MIYEDDDTDDYSIGIKIGIESNFSPHKTSGKTYLSEYSNNVCLNTHMGNY